MRRWPREAGHRVAGGIEGPDVTFCEDGIAPGAESFYQGGVELGIDQATVLVSGGIRETVDVSPEDRSAVVRLELPEGPQHLRAIFSGSTGFVCSAYYAHVRRVCV
jgi:hypothetical protein